MFDEEKHNFTSEPELEIVETPSGDNDINWADEARKYHDLYLRSAAEIENVRRRFQKEKEEQARYAGERIVKGLLPVMDNLEMALGYVKDDAPEDVKCLAEGVRLTLKGLRGVLADNGVKVIEAERGQAFDPNVHEALGHAPDDAIAPGSVCQLVQRGYTLNDRLIRPAKVTVAAAC